MNRRIFTLSSLAFTFVSLIGRGLRTTSADGDLIRKLDRARRAVGTLQGGILRIDFPDVTGWDLELEEDDNVVWDLVASNPGPKAIRAVHCQPFTTGPFQIVERLLVPARSRGRRIKRFRACNEDNFFFFEIETRAGVFVPMNGEPPNSDANLGTDHRVAHMSWHRPQEVALQVQLARGQHMTC